MLKSERERESGRGERDTEGYGERAQLDEGNIFLFVWRVVHHVRQVCLIVVFKTMCSLLFLYVVAALPGSGPPAETVGVLYIVRRMSPL